MTDPVHFVADANGSVRVVLDPSVQLASNPRGAKANLDLARLRARKSRARLIRVNHHVWRCRQRLSAAEDFDAFWLRWILTGATAVFFVGLIAVLIFGPRPALFLSIILVGMVPFLLCAGELSVGRVDETDENRIQLRRAKLTVAYDEQTAARADAATDKSILKEAQLIWEAAVLQEQRSREAIRQAIETAEYKRLVHTNRLLNVDRNRLSPADFERHVAEIFDHLGFATELVCKPGDQGVDVLARKGDLRIAIQAKRYSTSVGNGAVQEVVAGKGYYRCSRCLVVTNSTFTPQAVDLAQSNQCLLIGNDKMGALIRGEIEF